MSDYFYELNDSLYINLTNRCNNSCTFCIKYKTRDFESKYPLWLDREPKTDEIIKAIDDPKKYKQIVFCGFGEPLIRLKEVRELAKYFHDAGCYVRIDTDGQANIFHQRNIIPELSGIINEINISLNAHDADTYNKLCRSIFKDRAFPAIIDFAKHAKGVIPKVILSIVDLPSVDKNKCEIIANNLGLELKIRPYYTDKYVN